ncbi:MAG: biopolymer transporter ExbD [Panacagrimonas sp.]|jgi:biopolymer transport protein ExbD|nr:biopolymer transporter ExbD [Panacagrimonas sp.]MCC2655968.1 biopolymer transporter ExbD [Panacagrimonas sp.]
MNVGGAGSGNHSDPQEMVDINTTPLIDVMLVLLIMLIITIPVQTHAVKLDLPVDQSQAPPEPPPVVNIEVDFDGTVYWDGAIVADRKELETRFGDTKRLAVQPEFHIRPNRLVAYKYVVGVMSTAQKLGITNIGLVGTT